MINKDHKLLDFANIPEKIYTIEIDKKLSNIYPGTVLRKINHD